MKFKDACSLEEKVMKNLDNILKKQKYPFTNKGPSSQSYYKAETLPTKVHIVRPMVFPLVVYGCESLNHKESWALKNWHVWTVVLEKTFENTLDCKEIKAVNPKGNKFKIFIGRTDAEGETPILWPPDGKNWLFGKDPDSGEDWRQEEKGMTEDEMVGWHHWLDGHEFE